MILSKVEKEILQFIILYTHQRRILFISISILIKETGLSLQEIESSFHSLRKKGYLANFHMPEVPFSLNTYLLYGQKGMNNKSE